MLTLFHNWTKGTSEHRNLIFYVSIAKLKSWRESLLGRTPASQYIYLHIVGRMSKQQNYFWETLGSIHKNIKDMLLWPSNSAHKNVHLNIHSLSRYLLSNRYVPGSVLGVRDKGWTQKCDKICDRMKVCHASKLSRLCTNVLEYTLKV